MSSSLYYSIGGDKILLVEYHAKVVHVLGLMGADDDFWDSGSLNIVMTSNSCNLLKKWLIVYESL